LLHSFSINQNRDNTLYDINIELSRSGAAAQTQPDGSVTQVSGQSGAVPLT
jgi:hypothetical protein